MSDSALTAEVLPGSSARWRGALGEPATAMLHYASAMWDCRYFWLTLVRNDLRTRYRRSFLGLAWSLLNPIAMTTVICVVFHRLFQQDVRQFAPFLMVGLCFWTYLTTSVLQGCQSFYTAEAYIRQQPLPVAIYPLRVILGGGFHFALALLVAIALTWGFQGLRNLSVLPALLPALALLMIFVWSLAILFAFAHVYFPDTQYLAEVGLQILFYLTPILYPTDMLIARGHGWLAWANPLSSLLALLREPIVVGQLPSQAHVVVAVALVSCTWLAAVSVLSRLQRTLIFHL